jgi:hypothetical protein
VFVVKKGGQAARMCEMFQIHSVRVFYIQKREMFIIQKWAAVLGRSTEKMRIQAGPVKLSPVCELGKAVRENKLRFRRILTSEFFDFLPAIRPIRIVTGCNMGRDCRREKIERRSCVGIC